MSIDLCRPPYNCNPGTDVSTALQAAINAIGSAGVNGEVYFSRPGDYNINGALQTGTVLGYTYNGQILFPAVDSSHSLTIKIRGASTPPTDGGANRPATGTRLISNATAGYIFDAIPQFTAFSAENPWTNVMPVFEDIIVQAPSNPQCGGINALTCMAFQACRLVVQGGASGWPLSLTGSGIGLVLPQSQNSGNIKLHCNVRGWPYGIRLSEHVLLDYVRVSYCNVAFRAHKGGHSCEFLYVNIEGTPTIFKLLSTEALVVFGRIDHECVNVTPGPLIDQPAPLVGGKLGLYFGNPMGGMPLLLFTGGSAGPAQSQPYLDVELLNKSVPGYMQADGGWRGSHPNDNFARVTTPISAANGAPGMCWPSMHPWHVIQGAFQVANQQLASTNGVSISEAVVPTKGLGESRFIQATFTLAASNPQCAIEACRVNGGARNGNAIFALIHTNLSLELFINGSSVFTKSSAVTGGSTITLGLKVIYNQSLPSLVRLYLNGALLKTYPLTATQVANLAAGTFPPYLCDGVAIYEQNTVCTSYTVTPAPPDPYSLSNGTATLVAGTVDVIDANITANSIIRLNRQAPGGTLGELSVALVAGTKFTINSNNASDTSTVYYEVVAY